MMKKYMVLTVYIGTCDPRDRTQVMGFDTSADAAAHMDRFCGRKDIVSCICYECTAVDPHVSPLYPEKRKLKRKKNVEE